MGAWRQVPLNPILSPARSETTFRHCKPSSPRLCLTLLGGSPPLREVPSQKQQMPLSCRAGCWAQLSQGTRTEDVWL